MNKGILTVLAFIVLSFIACTPKEELAEQYYENGKDFFFRNDPKNALVEFEKGLELVPNHYRLLYESGNCHMNFREYNIAIDLYTKAIESNPKYADAYHNRGQCWFYLNNHDKSCSDWLKADSLGKPNLSDKIKHCK